MKGEENKDKISLFLSVYPPSIAPTACPAGPSFLLSKEVACWSGSTLSLYHLEQELQQEAQISPSFSPQQNELMKKILTSFVTCNSSKSFCLLYYHNNTFKTVNMSTICLCMNVCRTHDSSDLTSYISAFYAYKYCVTIMIQSFRTDKSGKQCRPRSDCC